MKYRKLLHCIYSLCLLSLCLTSCRTHGLLDQAFDAGETVTPEDLLEISRELFTQAEPPTQAPETESREPETLSPTATVYWLKNGSVYHASKDCHHISHATPEDIREGLVSDAVLDGKERLCTSCAP